jgi:MSHA biogenesis protein MshN
MSLINQMLKDLEERGASNADESAVISSHLSAANTANAHPIANVNLPLIKMGGLMIVLAGCAYLWTQNTQAQSRVAPAPQINTLKPIPIKAETHAIATNATIAAASEASASMPNQHPPLFETALKYDVSDMQIEAIEAPATQTKNSQHQEVLAKLAPAAAPKKQETSEAFISATLTEKAPTLAYIEKPASKLNADPMSLDKQIRPEQKSASIYLQAVTYLQQGRVTEAQANLALALETNPINHDARQMLAGLLLDNSRHDEAKAVLAAGIAIAPEQNGFRMALARLQVEAGDVSGAIYTLEQGLSFAKNNGDFQIFLATLLQRANRHEDAISHYRNALSLNSASANATANALVGLGISLQAVNQLAESQEVFSRAQSSTALSPELLTFVEQHLKQLNQRLQN